MLPHVLFCCRRTASAIGIPRKRITLAATKAIYHQNARPFLSSTTANKLPLQRNLPTLVNISLLLFCAGRNCIHTLRGVIWLRQNFCFPRIYIHPSGFRNGVIPDKLLPIKNSDVRACGVWWYTRWLARETDIYPFSCVSVGYVCISQNGLGCLRHMDGWLCVSVSIWINLSIAKPPVFVIHSYTHRAYEVPTRT